MVELLSNRFTAHLDAWFMQQIPAFGTDGVKRTFSIVMAAVKLVRPTTTAHTLRPFVIVV
ncbi:MAG: hypothetical protein ABJK89_13495 [Paracoccaceae bacterium]